jgi:transglutaminase-like putative cysteine protease
VCRDYAQLLVALVRAAAIPARIASVYAPHVDPPDFHAVAEVFLDGTWHMVDATGMAKAAEMVKIGVGRDAADIPFLVAFGTATMNRQTVSVTAD